MKKLNIFLLMIVAVTTLNITSCSDDDFTDTIFPVKSEVLDRSLYTFPLDTFVKVNFLEPYNINDYIPPSLETDYLDEGFLCEYYRRVRFSPYCYPRN